MIGDLIQTILEHIYIVVSAILISVVIGIILGILSYWLKYIDSVILWICDIIQTIPSLALLAILMILFGLGNVTMIVGLILYALLPIVRNTYTGLMGVPQYLKDASKGMGMSRIQRLIKVELPLAFPLMFSGIKIALVNSLSIAVMGVLIGSGGLGSIIYPGIQSQNIKSVIIGAIPVVVMALIFDYFMSKIEIKLSKKSNRVKEERV